MSLPDILIRYEKRIGVGLVVGLALTLFLPIKVTSYLLIVSVAYWLASGKYKCSIVYFKESWMVKVFVAYFFLWFFSVLYSENIRDGFVALERRVPLLVVSLVFPTFLNSAHLKEQVLKSFVVGAVLAAIFSLVSTYFHFNFSWKQLMVDREYVSYFSWVLVETINISSSYYALLIAFATLISIGLIATRNWILNSWLTWGILFFLVLFLAVLGARTSLLAVIVIASGYLLFLVIRKKLTPLQVGGVALAVIPIIFVIANVPFLQARITMLTNQGIEADPRFALFGCGIETFRTNPVFGAGLGDVESVALKCYESRGFKEAIENNFNFHNEFIQTAATSGLIGLVVLVTMLAVVFRRALKSGEFISIAFMVLFFLAIQTEVALARNKGIIFFTLFATLFFSKIEHEGSNPAH